MTILIAATAMSPMAMIINIHTKSMTTITMIKNTCIIMKRSIITCTRKAGMRRNMSMNKKRSRTNMITSIMTMIINAITITIMIMNMLTITAFTNMTIFMKKSPRMKRWLTRTYTFITSMIIVMKGIAIIAIMIVTMTTITTMTMIMLTINLPQAYQRGTSSISMKSIVMLILKGFHCLKPSKFR